MKLSYNWLSEYISPFDLSVGELCDILTNCGLEVEDVEQWSSVPQLLKSIIIGEIKRIEPHPDSTKLVITTVDVGKDKLQIICGAPNVQEHQKVLVAPPGATVRIKGSEVQIQKTEIRGVLSEGMICAEDEVGLGETHQGIIVLPSDAPVGKSAYDYLATDVDTVITIGLTPNRVDAASVIGVARDVVAVLNSRRNGQYRLLIPDVSDFPVISAPSPVSVTVQDARDCIRYSGLVINDIRQIPTPFNIKKRLEASGMRSLNIIVDVTNYVMLETGQPLHAFDLLAIKGNQVIVQKYTAPRQFVTLDGVERTIVPDDLMICNAEEPMCIAGVFGGLHSGVTDRTTDIFLESACFNASSIRRTSRRHNISSESSFRFERGSDPSATLFALKRAALLLTGLTQATISSSIIDIYPQEVKPVRIFLEYDYVHKVAGTIIEPARQRQILQDLGFQIGQHDNSGAEIFAPLAKVDVVRPIDVVEEILRIYGYNEIPMPANIQLPVSVTSDDGFMLELQHSLSERLTGRGFYEIMANTFTSSKFKWESAGFKEDQIVKVQNPISSELDIMRPSLVAGGLQSIVHNINRQASDIRLFEFGKVYALVRPQSDRVTDRYNERLKLGIWMTGHTRPVNWKHQPQWISFYDIKNVVEDILSYCGLQTNVRTVQHEAPLFHYALSYITHHGEQLSIVGLLNKSFCRLFDCQQDVFFAELDFEIIGHYMRKLNIEATDLPKFPFVERDIALLIDEAVTFESIQNSINSLQSPILKRIDIFDVYKGGQIPAGKKSYAIRLTLQHPSKTLTDEEIDTEIDRIKLQLIKDFQVIIR